MLNEKYRKEITKNDIRKTNERTISELNREKRRIAEQKRNERYQEKLKRYYEDKATILNYCNPELNLIEIDKFLNELSFEDVRSIAWSYRYKEQERKENTLWIYEDTL